MGVSQPWSAEGEQAAIERWGADSGVLLAQRCYTARLLGADPTLVLHGGGNTSVKGPFVDELGQTHEALFVKGSGWDLAAIEPPGHPAVDLARLRPLRSLPSLTDAQMVNAHRTRLFDASAPSPSVETLLHAFLPHRFIDHSHANAIVALTNLADGRRHVEAALGGLPEVAVVDYVMPGFQLARACADAVDAHPDCIGLVLLNHGLFTFGDTAQQSYARHVELVDRARAYLAKHAPVPDIPHSDLEQARAGARAQLPTLRKLLQQRWIFDYRVDADLLAALDHPDVQHFAQSGPLTPDHVIRTKARPWLVGNDPAASLDAYHAAYRAYVEANLPRHPGVQHLDPDPRVVWIPGVGVFGLGKTARDASIAADIAEHTLRVKHQAAALGPYRGLPESDLFDMEYWSLEQAKLGKRVEPPLARRVAWVTGGAGAIGVGIATELLRAGAHVALVDRDADRLAEAVALLDDPRVLPLEADVTDLDSVRAALDATVLHFGGVDLLVLGAGIAICAPITDTTPDAFDRVVSVNLGGVHRCLHAGARLLQEQGRGGQIVLVSSKNVLGPGAAFGAYSASKAAAHQLCKVAALELAPHRIRVNLVAPDAVFAEGPIKSGLWEEVGPERARAKGLAEDRLAEHYRQRNLLQLPITGRDVGRAVVFFATEQTPTTGATLPVDGGVPGAFPR
jgi:rhamnose utilization protein RhaD (predicted bifunctional aldolase and dehydrogenase)/NAD(P)-dependent dehydrogenase (short-subunit alcohol dehydrogenase family)